MGIGKLKPCTKVEVASFIYYGNIREFVFKNWDTPTWENLSFFGEIYFTIGFADPMFLIQCTTLWSYDCRKWVIFFTKNCILQ